MKPEKAQLVVQGLKEAGVDFTAGVPDAQFIEVYKMLAADPDIRYVGTANEAEAVGVGFGAWFGGKKPALILATSGLLVATYHLARVNIMHEVPLLVVVPIVATLVIRGGWDFIKKLPSPVSMPWTFRIGL